MIKNDCLIEMMSHRFIIERHFFAFGVPAVLCAIRKTSEAQAVLHTKQSAEKESRKECKCAILSK